MRLQIRYINILYLVAKSINMVTKSMHQIWAFLLVCLNFEFSDEVIEIHLDPLELKWGIKSYQAWYFEPNRVVKIPYDIILVKSGSHTLALILLKASGVLPTMQLAQNYPSRVDGIIKIECWGHLLELYIKIHC